MLKMATETTTASVILIVKSPPQITSSSPNHPANSFFYPRLKHLPPIAKVTLTKIKKTNQIISFPVEPTQSNQLPTDNEIEEKHISKFTACRRLDSRLTPSPVLPHLYPQQDR